MIVVGAGLAGCLAALAWPQAGVYEAAPAPAVSHKALLRFRSDAVSKLTGIEFRAVTVRKGIFFNERYVPADPQIANLYARKVLGELVGDRSIWNLEPVTRFIAPEDLYEQLINMLGDRVRWGEGFNFERYALRPQPTLDPGSIISTAPLPITLKGFGIEAPFEFKRSPIRVARYRVAQCDVFMTAYFPAPAVRAYRASLTGSLLIVESMPYEIEADQAINLHQACHAFGIHTTQVEPIDSTEQKFGKILPLPDAARKALLYRLTTEFGVYSLGRFACWKNILLDDVVEDINVLRRLLKSNDYERALRMKGGA